MKVIISGSRNFHDYDLVKSIITQSHFNITEVINGMAKGVDYCGVLYAAENNIPLANFQAEWLKYGKAAGPIRNESMAQYADAAIICILNYSPGSMNMLFNMKKLNKRYYVVFLRPPADNAIISTIIMDDQTEKDHSDGNTPISEGKRSDIKTRGNTLRFFKSSDKSN